MATTIEEIKGILKEFSLGINDLKEAQTRTDSQINELKKAQSKTDAQIKETNKQLGGIGNSNGKFAENFFFHALEEKMQLGTIRFDDIQQNMRHKRKGLVDEFDIVMYNGNSVAIVEVKYCVESKHIKKLKTQKTENFKLLYPEYEGYKIYLGLAGMSFENAGVLEEAQEEGIATLEAKGDFVEIHAENLSAF